MGVDITGGGGGRETELCEWPNMYRRVATQPKSVCHQKEGFASDLGHGNGISVGPPALGAPGPGLEDATGIL